MAVLPLALFQPNDPVQLDRLADAIATLPERCTTTFDSTSSPHS